MKKILGLTFLLLAMGFGIYAVNAAVTGPLTCFDGPSDGSIYGGDCTITAGIATLDNTGGDTDGSYSGVYYPNDTLRGMLLSDINDLSFNYTGTPTAGSPRINLPIDTNGDGSRDDNMSIAAINCNDGAGLVDVLNDSTCTIYVNSDGTNPVGTSWAAVLAAHPTWRVADEDSYIIADDAGLWTLSNVVLGAAATADSVNICHKTSDTWQFMAHQPSASLAGHLGHGDFEYTGAVGQGNDQWCIDNAPNTGTDPEDGKVHILKYIDEKMATAINADNTSFPMITPTYGDAAFTLDADGWTTGDEPYEATTSTIEGGGKYTAYENLSTQTVGESCDDENSPAYALVGYTTGSTIEEAEEGDVSTHAPEVTVNGDQYIIVWNKDCSGTGGEDDPETATLSATKIVCPTEADLPNWSGGANITSTTATEFLATHPQCRLEPNWKFQARYWEEEDSQNLTIAPNASDPGGAFVGETSSPWETLTGSTNTSGTITTTFDSENVWHIFVREVLKSGYIPFAAPENTTSNISAEMYCGSDVLNYDNLERIDGPFSEGQKIYCVAFNVPTTPPNQCDATATSTIVSDTSTNDGDGNASALTFVHPGWTASIPGATWIWATDPVQSPTNDGDLTKTFTKTFNIVGTPTSGTLQIAADNSYTVKVNGNIVPVVFDQNNFQAGTQDSYDVSAFLVSGTNTLEIKVTNQEDGAQSPDPAVNPAGLLYKLTLGNNECVTPPGGGGTPPSHAKVTIVKYLDVDGDTDAAATSGNTNNSSFSMHAVFPGGEGDYNLSSTGFNNPNPYQATTSDMALGSNYSTSENFNSVVGASCVEGNNTPKYKLVGYKTGQTLAGALASTLSASTLSLTAPSFTNLQSDMFVVVINDQCPGDTSQNPTSADLSVTKTVSDGTPDENQSITYTVTVTNNGPVNATGIVVTDLLPSGLTYSSNSTVTGSYVSGTGVWTIGNLANGASAVLTITATVNDNTSGDTINNTATVDGDQTDNDAEDNSATISAEVNGGGGGSSSSSGSSRRSSGSRSNSQGQVLGAQISSSPIVIPPAETFFPQVLGAQIGLPYTGGGNYIFFSLILALSGFITLISLAYLSTNHRDEMEF